MTKRKFLAKLESALSSLNAEERSRQLDYYEEMIDDMMDEGLSEESAVERLGSVQCVAAKILSTASPDMLKKSRSPLKKTLIIIAIVFAVIELTAAVLFSLFNVNRVEHSAQGLDVDDILENILESDENWLFGVGESFDADSFDAIAISWGAGKVEIIESEGREVEVVVKSNRDDALEYKLDDGVLCIKNTEKYADEKANLTIAVPEEMLRMNELCVVTTSGDVNIDSEAFDGLEIVTAAGNVRIDENEAAYVQVVTASGDIVINTDEDDAFTLDYATESGDVSVGFDRKFKNESGGGKEVRYDHSFGNSNCRRISAVTATGDIMILDD